MELEECLFAPTSQPGPSTRVVHRSPPWSCASMLPGPRASALTPMHLAVLWLGARLGLGAGSASPSGAQRRILYTTVVIQG